MQQTHRPADRPLAGIGIRVVATLLLTSMFAFAKLAQGYGVNIVELVFFRQFIAILPVLLLVLAGPGLASLRTSRPWMHASRTAVGTTGMVLNFLTVSLLPLAETQALWFTTPLFATILSAMVLHEAVGRHRWSAVALGFVGVLIVVQPQSGHLPIIGAVTGLTSALLTGFVTILLRQLGRTEPALTTVFWFFTMSSLPLAFVMPWFVQSHPPVVWVLLIGMGIVGGLGQVALTLSLRYAPVSALAPVDYASLIWSTLFGVLLFAEIPTVWTWVGAPIIIASGLYIVWREHRLRLANTLAASAAEA
ncbi:DMT family transporter [Sphingomonas sp. SUN039]|uniref:DMT family transporter n=1 Tax=Sphingomonas sp. SUN039 TaxID=2937787 RepID=UPI0021644DDD|nr:DMT family transporter [Sphingomonas sp. SUN039]UVO53363.1 DMT family transporter [Sphingomonas sp. SUN039]